ncbi:MAG: hypothetical protein WDN46_24215 [Methylocella sp.]
MTKRDAEKLILVAAGEAGLTQEISDALDKSPTKGKAISDFVRQSFSMLRVGRFPLLAEQIAKKV